MSVWYEPKLEDIDFSNDGEEMHILFDTDLQGNKYVSLNVKDVQQKLSEYRESNG